MKTRKLIPSILLSATALVLGSQAALAADRAQAARSPDPKDTDVSSVRDRYWARGDEAEIGVVQNRLYSKSHRLQLTAFGGTAASDPFLSIYNAGGSLGFYFNEVLSLNVVGWRHFVQGSAALNQLQNQLKVSTNTNIPSSYLGGELGLSFIYGKLSLAGASIIHYDLFGLAGAGITSTESGNYITPSVGLGQQVYLSRHLALRVDYRLMYYHENVFEKVQSVPAGTIATDRDNWTNNVSLGFSFML